MYRAMGIIKFTDYLLPDNIYHGDAKILLRKIEPDSIALSIWSPPYFLGKDYEKHLAYDDWKSLLRETINLHYGRVFQEVCRKPDRPHLRYESCHLCKRADIRRICLPERAAVCDPPESAWAG